MGGDLAWDYLFVSWIEGTLDTDASLAAISIPATVKRPWFEIWCVMIIILFLIFMVFLCLLHWKRKYDEDQERKEDKKFQAELRQRAIIQAEAERNAKNGIVEESDEYDDNEADGISDYDEEEDNHHGTDQVDEYEQDRTDQFDEYDDGGKGTKSHLTAPGGKNKNYNRVKSASRNEMPSEDEDGYQDVDKKKRKTKIMMNIMMRMIITFMRMIMIIKYIIILFI